jgi:hypothetical protein
MRVWILERIPDTEQLWMGYHPVDRIAVVASSCNEAREIAGKTQDMPGRYRASGQQALNETNIAPWHNTSASTCREISDESGACVLAIQGPEVYVKDPRVMA